MVEICFECIKRKPKFQCVVLELIKLVWAVSMGISKIVRPGICRDFDNHLLDVCMCCIAVKDNYIPLNRSNSSIKCLKRMFINVRQ